MTTNIGEIYKPIIGFEKFYEVSSHGNVKSLRTGHILLKHEDTSGYYRVTLFSKEKRNIKRVHRYMAESFYDEIYKNSSELNKLISKNDILTKYHVDHIDGNKLNNHISNLRFVTQNENGKNAHRHRNCERRRVIQYDLDGNIVCEYSSIIEACKLNEYKTKDNIERCCNRKQNDAYGYIWKYVDEKIPKKAYIPQENERFVKIKNFFGYDFCNYEISNFGNIRNFSTKFLIKPAEVSGYYQLRLPGSIKKSIKIHRLVAYYFVEYTRLIVDKNILIQNGYKFTNVNGPITLSIISKYCKNIKVNSDEIKVNHKDENKLNNHHSNLEWMTHNENINYSCAKAVIGINLTTNEIKKYDSINAASKESKCYNIQIKRCLEGKIKMTNGYKWEYVDPTLNKN